MKFNKDILFLYVLFLLAVVFTYKMPHIVSLIFQIILLFAFWRSKKDYFWLAFVFIIQNFPGGLFSRFTHDMQHTFSLINRGNESGTLYFWMVFVILALIKSFKIKSEYKIVVITNVKILFGYFGILVLAFGIYKITAVSRTLLPWLFLFILPKLMAKKSDYINFFNLIFSFVFFVIIAQIVQIIFGITMAKALGGSMVLSSVEELKGVARPVDGIYIPFISIWGALFFLTFKEKYFERNYLITIIGLSLFSIFITATRTWIISSLFIFITYGVYVSKSKTFIIKKLVLPGLLMVIMINVLPILDQQVNLAFKRFETIQYLLQGDLTAGGTLKRLDVRGPRVMSKFYQSPIVGWGYGTEAREYSDGHVGNQNLLMHTGVIGYGLWVSLWLAFLFKMNVLNKKLNGRNPYKDVPKIFSIILIGILIIHASAQWFGYLLGYLSGFSFLFLFAFASFVYKDSLRFEHSLKYSVK